MINNGSNQLMEKSQSSLAVKSIHKNYEGAPLLRGIDLKVEGGQTLCLLGRSGSGKSTLLRIVAGLETPDEGQVWWNGAEIDALPAWQRHFGSECGIWIAHAESAAERDCGSRHERIAIGEYAAVCRPRRQRTFGR